MAQILFDLVVTSPPAPSAGMITIFAKSDGTLWKKEADGTETPIDNEGYALLDSPIFIGDPRAPTPPTPDNDTSIATTAYVKNSIGTDRPYSSTNPIMDGVANSGNSADVSRGNHVHPTDTSRAPASAATAVGTSVTPAGNVSSTNVQAALVELDGDITLLNIDITNLYNTKVTKTSNTGSALLPAGTDAQRDATPQLGAIRFSSTQTGWEGWNGTNWVSIGGGIAFCKNKLFNGEVTRINQRGVANWAAVANGAYGYDRWKKIDASNMTQIIEAGNFRPSTIHTLSGNGVTTQQLTSPASGNWQIPNIPIAATNVQLEEGREATPFEIRPISFELAQCQRYFLRGPTVTALLYLDDATYRRSDISFPTTMRIAPSATVTTSAGSLYATGSTTYGAGTSVSGVTVFDSCTVIWDSLSAEL